jgi:Nucleotidyl transferase AbiEii toxin, Type IV TA system
VSASALWVGSRGRGSGACDNGSDEIVLTPSTFAKSLVLKGGVLLAGLDARGPTRDIDLAASALRNTEAEILAVVREIAGISLDDGIEFDSQRAVAGVIQEEDEYSGIRVTLDGKLSRAAIRLHVDVNVGDPIWPEPQYVSLLRLLDRCSGAGARLLAIVIDEIGRLLLRGSILKVCGQPTTATSARAEIGIPDFPMIF